MWVAPLIVVATILGWRVLVQIQEQRGLESLLRKSTPAPVEVAAIQRGPIELRRTFSGALEATAEFVVAPKVSGVVEVVSVDISDPVKRGQVVAKLDDDEYVQAVAQARADLEVAKANLAEARSALEISNRELNRIETLRKRGVMSESQLDAARADQLAKKARLEVAEAQVTRAEALLETARIRLGYTKVNADWTGGDDQRTVAERYVDAGETVSANARLLSIVELNPIMGVIFVTEKDYAQLRPGQPVSLSTDAYPGEEFPGLIDRIAPVFRQATRQARVQLNVDNPRHRLKPGMFIRATVVLQRMAEAIIVPERALTRRGDQVGVFVVNEQDLTVVWREVRVGIHDGERVQVEGEGLTGRVVTLGQQLVNDGAAISIPGEGARAVSPGNRADAG